MKTILPNRLSSSIKAIQCVFKHREHNQYLMQVLGPMMKYLLLCPLWECLPGFPFNQHMGEDHCLPFANSSLQKSIREANRQHSGKQGVLNCDSRNPNSKSQKCQQVTCFVFLFLLFIFSLFDSPSNSEPDSLLIHSHNQTQISYSHTAHFTVVSFSRS